MPAKMVTDREKATRALWATGETYADEVAAAHGRRYAPVLAPGETMPDIALVQRLSVREVVHKCQALTAADRAHAQRQRELTSLRNQRQEATATLRSMLVSVRRLYEGHHRSAVRHAGRSLLGFQGRIPEQPNTLARQAVQTIAHLRHLATQPALMPATAQWINPNAWADKLEPVHATLARCLVELGHARGAAISTLATKRRAMQAFDNAYGSAVRELACLYKLVGLPQRVAALPSARLRRDARRPVATTTRTTATTARTTATTNKVTAPQTHPPAALPTVSASEEVLRVHKGAEGVSEAELRVRNGARGASEGALRVQNAVGSASEGELRVRNGAHSASEDALRVQDGARLRFSRTRRHRPSLRAAYAAAPAHRMVSPRHVSAHRRRARP